MRLVQIICLYSLHEYYYSVISLTSFQNTEHSHYQTTATATASYALVAVWKLEIIPLYEVPVSRKRPRKEVRLQVTLEGGYSSRVSDKRWKRVPDTCPCNRKGTVADCHSTEWRNHPDNNQCLSRKRYDIGSRLLRNTNRKLQAADRSVSVPTT